MNVLVIGDEHSYGYGLRPGQLSYVCHLIRQVSRSGQSIRVEVYTPPTALQLVNTLNQLPLHQYDLILVQTERIADELKSSVTWPGLTWLSKMPTILTEMLIRLASVSAYRCVADTAAPSE